MRSPFIAALLIPLLAGCVVGPDYKRPVVAGADGQWTEPAAADAVDPEPWRALGDPLLTELIEKAVAGNLDLREAEARLSEARAARDAVAGTRSPELGANASASQRRLSQNGQFPISRVPGVARNFSLFDLGFDASWEIDLWGGDKRAVEAAAGRMEAARAHRRDIALRVIAEVEREYAELRGAQAEGAIQRRQAEIYTAQAALLRQLFETGEVSRSADADADVRARQAEAALAMTEPRARAAINRLAVLTGQVPEALAGKLAPGPIPKVPDQIAAGLRSDMLRRRPDVIAAEAQLTAANADVGVETAKLFPKLSLTGSIGTQDRGGNDLFAGGSTYFAAGPGLSWPIFARGRIKAQIRGASARADAAGAVYERTVLEALADSETALNRYAATVAAARALETASQRSAASLALSQARYRQGEDNRLDLLDAELKDQAVRLADVRMRTKAVEAHAALVKALGGGWKDSPAENP